MPSKQNMRLKSEVHKSNINKRGAVEKSLVQLIQKKKEDKFPVGPLLLGVFLFVVVGSGQLSLYS